MEIVTSTQALESLCSQLSQEAFVTVDTEFMREQTYWPELCLVQIAGAEHEAIIDPLAPELELESFWQLMVEKRVVKVFHAARQDVEIVYSRAGVIPTPLFDTQVAAMVCGFGDQASYEVLARKLARTQIDKTSRFTDWSRRPLSPKQLAYALVRRHPSQDHLSAAQGRARRVGPRGLARGGDGPAQPCRRLTGPSRSMPGSASSSSRATASNWRS